MPSVSDRHGVSLLIVLPLLSIARSGEGIQDTTGGQAQDATGMTRLEGDLPSSILLFPSYLFDPEHI